MGVQAGVDAGEELGELAGPGAGGHDAVLVVPELGEHGADNPRLQVRSAARRRHRAAAGLPASPRKVTISGTGDLDPRSLFFAAAAEPPPVYVPAAAADRVAARLSGSAAVVAAAAAPAGGRLDLGWLVADLAMRGIARLMAEGGATVLAQLLAAGPADEFRLAVAAMFVADARAPRLLNGMPPGTLGGRMRLQAVSQAGDMAVLCYRPSQPGSPDSGAAAR